MHEKTNVWTTSLVRIKCTWALSSTNVAARQAGKRVVFSDRHVVKGFRISNLGFNHVAGTQCYLLNPGINAWHWPTCVRIEPHKALKIHQLPLKWRGHVCPLIFPPQQWLHFHLFEESKEICNFPLKTYSPHVHPQVYNSIKVSYWIIV